MFEKWIASLLTRLLGEYVQEQCFRPDRIHNDIWDGAPPPPRATRALAHSHLGG